MYAKLMNHAVWTRMASVGALALGLSACSGGGGGDGGGSMYVESCSLGCTNGEGGAQVSCGIINTFQNQDFSILFSQPVALGSVNSQSFQIVEIATGAFPPGDFVLEANNPRRLTFRPLLDFDANGNPIFGLQANRSYQLRIAGEKQGDNGPFIQSTSGARNQSRLLCTITTDQGLNDPVPGAPIVKIFVDTICGSNMDAQTLPPGCDVTTTSNVRMVFNDIMDIGTLVVGGVSPFISVDVDSDGNILTTGDRIALSGAFTYTIDQGNLTTTVTFIPLGGMPSKGADPLAPRRVVIDVPIQVRDLAGNSLANPGQVVVTPVAITYQAQVLPPPGGEDFTTTNRRDAQRTGAAWGTTIQGKKALGPGTGGGSGRLGDLRVKSNQTVTLYTSPTKALGTITCSSNPKDGDRVNFTGSTIAFLQFLAGVPTGTSIAGGGLVIENHPPFTSYSLAELVNFLNGATGQADPQIALATYWVSNGNTVNIQYKTAGTAGNSFAFGVLPGTTTNVFSVSGPTLSGGVDIQTIAKGNLIDNFDFDANPAGSPFDITVSNAIFEFATLKVDQGGRLRFVGDEAPRVFVRGQADVQGVIDVSGQSPGAHPSDAPLGQRGGGGGPKAGDGGKGGDRRDYTGTNMLGLPPQGGLLSAGVKNPGSFIVGVAGEGVGGTGLAAAGPGGGQWPILFPNATSQLGDLATDVNCVSEQVAGPGGGGAYSADGKPGVPMALNAQSQQGTQNFPSDTPGGDSSVLGIEPPFASPLVIRKLNPEAGHLRGGAGGGGAGTAISQTMTNGFGNPDVCVGTGALIDVFRDHSGASGGGGGGAIQLEVGESVRISGTIEASGGSGGSAQSGTAPINAQGASPGGGGSGGALLLRTQNVQLTGLVPPRIDVSGGFGGVDNTGSVGGDGSAGLLRIETALLQDLNNFYFLLNPVEAPPAGVTTYNSFTTLGTWKLDRKYPQSINGAQSCWFRPSGVTFFEIDFKPDDFANNAPGWDMDILFKGQAQPVSYRKKILASGTQSWEDVWGTNLQPDLPVGEVAAPLVVRFQGIRTSKAIADYCNIDITDPSSGVLPSTLTPWVTRADQLNDFQPHPDLIRYVILFDMSHPDFVNIAGITNLRIHATPD